MQFSTVRTMTLTALCALTVALPMNAAEQAKFHLPVQAHWGKAILEPGDYRVSLPAPSLGRTSFHVEGGGKTLLEMPQVTSYEGNAIPSHLKLTEVDGAYFIR